VPFVLYQREAFQPLTETPWDDARVRDAIRRIVADVDAAYDADALWPADEWDGWQAATPMKNLYVGAAGVIHGLDVLRSRGVAETTVDVAAAALRTLDAFRAAPDFISGFELPSQPAASLLCGEAGILLVAWRSTRDPGVAEALLEHVRRNRDNEAGEMMWRLEQETATLLEREAVFGDDCANWPLRAGAPLQTDDGEIRLQWCGGAPGIVVSAAPYLDEELLLAGARVVWQAGPPGMEKGPSICHGTAGNGYAFLKAFARTQDEEWLIRARRFGAHALEQVDRRGRGRYSLWTGDLGVALYAADCLEPRTSYPILETWE
jgi:hypothetical protein